jgi:hypothetical protein
MVGTWRVGDAWMVRVTNPSDITFMAIGDELREMLKAAVEAIDDDIE